MSEDRLEYDRALAALAEALSGRDDWALIGGLAVAFRGVPRTTRDIDLLLAIPRIALPGALERLQEAGFSFDADQVLRELRDDHLSRIHRASIRVDLLSAVIGAFAEIVASARWEDLGGRRLRVASAEGLVLLKLAAFRPQDEADLLGLIAMNRESLDLDRIRRWYLQVGEEADERWRAWERMVAEVEGREGRRA